MAKNKQIAVGLAAVAGALALLQLLRFGLKNLFFLWAGRTAWTDRVASFAALSLLTAGMLLTARLKKIPLSVFPARFSLPYILAAALFGVLLGLTAFLTGGTGEEIFLLLYSAVLMPLFEELIFRGFVWDRLEMLFKKEWVVWLVDSLLFALWHFGYADSLSLRVTQGLGTALAFKAVTGLCFGIMLGALRCRTKNSFSTMLLHGAMNLFGR